MKKTGTLYGLGVGPGDPELITLKAWRILSLCPVVAYLTANGTSSTARDIAKPFLPDGVIELAIDVPMQPDRIAAMAAYDEGAAAITQHLKAGRDVALLCEGDPFFYGSFIYLFARLADRFKTITVPGVSSITAAAAQLGKPIAARDDIVKIIPATLGEDQLRSELSAPQAAVIIKVGRHFAKLKNILRELGRLEHTAVIEYATRDNERIRPAHTVMEETLPYFTTVVVYRGETNW